MISEKENQYIRIFNQRNFADAILLAKEIYTHYLNEYSTCNIDEDTTKASNYFDKVKFWEEQILEIKIIINRL